MMLQFDVIEKSVAILKKNLRSDGTIAKPVSMVQRHLGLGYTDAKSVVEQIKRLRLLSQI